MSLRMNDLSMETDTMQSSCQGSLKPSVVNCLEEIRVQLDITEFRYQTA